MIEWLMRLLGIVTDERELEKYEPIYGLPRESLDDWLSRNPALKKIYEAELRARSLRRGSVQ